MAKSKVEERVEAVIISGPRKGELITLANGAEPQLTPEEEAALDFAIEAAGRAAESARAAVEAAQKLNRKLDDVHRRLHEPIGEAGRNGQVSNHDRHAVEAVG